MGSADSILILGLIFAGLSVYLFLNALLSSNSDKQQLSWANSSEPVKSQSGIINFSRPLIHQFTLQHALRIQSVDYRKRVSKAIKTGGLARELNVDEFIGMQLLWAVFFPAFCTVMNFALEMGFSYFLIGLLVPIGFYLPMMHANAMKKKRELSVRADMPFYVDLLALSVEAGLDLFQAIQKIVDKAEGTGSVLAEELSVVLKDVQIGSSKDQALKELAERLDMSEITSFVAVLIDAGKSGAPIAQVLKDQSNQMRLERFVRAEKLGARASQAMLIPMMLFIVPAVFIMVLGPVILSFYYGKK
ncbi:MAG: type II secretion system F family protein [Bdellovibrionales bacterium]